MRSTNENAAKWSAMPVWLRFDAAFPLRGDDEFGERRRREQPRDVLHLGRRLEAVGRNLGQVVPELLQADVGDDAVLLEFGFRQRAAGVLDDLAARDLHLEGALEAK